MGTGGYICGPVFHVALKRKIPTVLHESNAYPGKAVKHFSKKVDKILVGFEETKSKLEGAKEVVVTGTPTKIRKLNISNIRKKELLEDTYNKFPKEETIIYKDGAKTVTLDKLKSYITDNVPTEYLPEFLK